jgi:sRNA-binding regulator protein Hfq
LDLWDRILEVEKYISLYHIFPSKREPAMGNSTDQTADSHVTATTGDSKTEKKSGGPPQFLPKLLNRTIMIRMMDGRPIKGVLEAFNAYELLIDLGHRKKMILFKGAVSTIEFEDKPPKEKKDVKRW